MNLQNVQAETNKALRIEAKALRSRLATIESLIGESKKTVRQAAKATPAKPRAKRGAVKAALIEVLGGFETKQAHYKQIAERVTQNPVGGKSLTEQDVSQSLYALASKENSEITMVGKGVFALSNAAA